jgi:hypothetical protein
MVISIPKELIAGVLGVGIRLSIKGFIEEIFDASQSQKIPMTSFAPGSGEPSGSTSSSAAEASNSLEKKPEGRVITDSDYELSESDDYPLEENDHLEEDDPNESAVSKFIYSNDFKDRVNRLTKEEAAEAVNTIGFMKEDYEKSQVPAAKKQIEILNEKEALCLERLEKILKEEEEESNVKGKGKEKEN